MNSSVGANEYKRMKILRHKLDMSEKNTKLKLARSGNSLRKNRYFKFLNFENLHFSGYNLVMFVSRYKLENYRVLTPYF